MTIRARLRADLLTAMRERDELRTSVLRMTMAALTNAEVAGKAHKELTEDDVVRVLRSEAKQRAESAAVYEKAGRGELAAKELAEAAIIEEYLPAEMDDDALAAIVAEEITTLADAGVTGQAAMGRAIKAVRERVGTQADGARVAAAVKAALSQ